MTSKLKLVYICPKEHKLRIAGYYREIYCEPCNIFYNKADCKRYRIDRYQMLVPAPTIKKDYNHEYYLKRRAGLCRKQTKPRTRYGSKHKEEYI